MLSNEHESILKIAWSKFGHRSEVNGVDIGYKYIGGIRTDMLCVRCIVSEKHPSSAIPAHLQVGANDFGLQTDVIVARPTMASGAGAAGARGNVFNTIVPGVSVGRADALIRTGTLGAIVRDRTTGEECMLSCWHVLDGTLASDVPRISQPSLVDYSAGRPIATLRRGDASEDFDAAIAGLDPNVKRSYTQFECNKAVGAPKPASLGQNLTKSGRSTGVTNGIVDGIGFYKYWIPGGYHNIRGFRISAIDSAQRICAPGDSGAVWFDTQDASAVGLHVAAEKFAPSDVDYAIACTMLAVTNGLGIDLAT